MREISFDDGITYIFGPHLAPVATVRSGETVEFVCQDSCGGQIQSEGDTLDQLQMDRVNGATGPVAVAGAQRGDAIRVRIRDIRVGPTGFQSIVSSYGVLGEEVRSPRTKMIPIREGKAVFSKGIRLPIRPHVGTIGVAPASQEWTTFYPGDHGGNLDTKEITKGNSVYLPVFQPGGQLAMGDLHALMADGEVCVTGSVLSEGEQKVIALADFLAANLQAEAAEKQLMLEELDVEKRLRMIAAKLATHDGVAFLARGADLPWDEAYMLASIACDLRISQDVDPWRTAKLVIPKKLVPRLPTR